MNGYELTSKLRKARRRHPLTATEQALFYELVAICNDVDWDDVFQCSNDELCNALNVSENTLNASRNSLINAGLVFYRSGKSKRQFGKYSFTQKLTTSKIEVDAEGGADTNAATVPWANAATDAVDYIKTKGQTETKPLVPAQAPPPPLVKKNLIKKKGKEEKETEPHWDMITKVWFDFNKKEFGDEPSFERDDPKILKRIVHRLKKRAAVANVEWTEVTAPARFKSFLDKCFADQWLRTNFLLSNLEKQFDKIILNQNGKQNQKNGKHTGIVQPRVVDTNENWGR